MIDEEGGKMTRVEERYLKRRKAEEGKGERYEEIKGVNVGKTNGGGV